MGEEPLGMAQGTIVMLSAAKHLHVTPHLGAGVALDSGGRLA